MSAEELIENQDLLIDFIWGELDRGLSDKIDCIVDTNSEVLEIIEAITYLTIKLDLDKDEMKHQIKSLHQKIAYRINKS